MRITSFHKYFLLVAILVAALWSFTQFAPHSSAVTGGTVSVSISPASTSINVGSSVTISWNSSAATECTDPFGGTSFSGAQTITPNTTDTYTISCYNAANDSSASRSTTITVITGPAPSVSLGISPTSIEEGQSATVSWSVSYSDNGSYSTTCTDPFGGSSTSGAQQVSPTVGSYNYSFSCQGNGQSRSTSRILNVSPKALPQPTVAVSVNPTSIMLGSTATLSWYANDATSCSGTTGGSSATSGSTIVKPAASGNTTYTVTCTGAGGTGSGSATLSVTSVTLSVNVVASPSTIIQGDSATVSWTSTNAVGCTTPWPALITPSGSAFVTPSVTTTYTVTCTDSSGRSASNAATITVGGATVNVSVSPGTINQGGSATVSWTSSGNATSCSGDTGGSANTSGSYTVSPRAGMYTYTITCTGWLNDYPAPGMRSPVTGSGSANLTVNSSGPVSTIVSYSPKSLQTVLVGSTLNFSETTKINTTYNGDSRIYILDPNVAAPFNTRVIADQATGPTEGDMDFSINGSYTFNNTGNYTVYFEANAKSANPGSSLSSDTKSITVKVVKGQDVTITVGYTGPITFTPNWKVTGGGRTCTTNPCVFPSSYPNGTAYTISVDNFDSTYTFVRYDNSVTFRTDCMSGCFTSSIDGTGSTITLNGPPQGWDGSISGTFTIVAAKAGDPPPPCSGACPPTGSAPSVSLTANPTTINSGATSTLTAVVSDATSCTTANWSANVGNGTSSYPVSPTSSTTYSLTCYNANGSNSSQVTVNVNVINGPYTLVVTTSGAGTGIVTGGDGGASGLGKIICPGTCSASYSNGIIVNLTASPTNNSIFAGWSGACTGTGACKVTMDQAKSVNAQFDPPLAPSADVKGRVAGSGSFSDGPLDIDLGQAIDLTWSSSNATSCTGTNPSGWTGSSATSGSITFVPNSTVTYVLTCTGPGGTTNDSFIVNVNPYATIEVATTPISGQWSISPDGINGSGTFASYQVAPEMSGTIYTINGNPNNNLANYSYVVSPLPAMRVTAGQTVRFTITYSEILAAPSNVTVTSSGCQQATISFTDNSVGETQFLIYRDNNNNFGDGTSPSSPIATIPSTSSAGAGQRYDDAFTDLGVPAGNWWYEVIATKPNPSNPVSTIKSSPGVSPMINIGVCPPQFTANIQISQVTRGNSTFNYTGTTQLNNKDILTIDVVMVNQNTTVAQDLRTLTALSPNLRYQQGMDQVSYDGGNTWWPAITTYMNNTLTAPAKGSLGDMGNATWIFRFKAQIFSSLVGIQPFDRINANGTATYTFNSADYPYPYDLHYPLVFLGAPQSSQIQERAP